MTFSIDLSQLDELNQKLAQYGQYIKDEVAISGAAAMANVMYREVQHNAMRNKKSGLLVSAVYRKLSHEQSGETVKLYRISWNKRKAPHGHLIEFGTVRAPAYPFLRPALSQSQAAIDAGRARMAEKLADLDGEL